MYIQGGRALSLQPGRMPRWGVGRKTSGARPDAQTGAAGPDRAKPGPGVFGILLRKRNNREIE